MSYRRPPPAEKGIGSIHLIEGVPPVAQKAYQCGPAAMESVFHYWGNPTDAAEITTALYKPGSHGVLDFTLAEFARSRGFWTQILAVPEGENSLGELKTWVLRKIPPIVMIKTGILWVPTYHFVVLKGFSDQERVFYANTGEPETYVIDYGALASRWKPSGNWCLILCPPERVDWELPESAAEDLALYAERFGKQDLAEKWYLRILEKNPANQTARFNLGNIYLKSNRVQEAKIIYEALLKEKPGWGPAGNNLAWIYLEEGRASEAIEVLQTAFKNGAERHFDILDTLGTAYCRTPDTQRGRDYLNEALGQTPVADKVSLDLIHRHLSECGVLAHKS